MTTEWELLWQGGWSSGAIAIAILLALASLGLSFWAYRRVRRPVARAGLLALRTLAFFGVLLLLLQPAIDVRKVRRGRNAIAVIVDDSRSMTLRDAVGGATRLERARAVIAGASSTFEAWRRERDVDFYTFSDTVEATSESAVATKPRADATRIGEALESLQRRYAARDLGAIVLLSDGADNGRLGKKLDETSAQQIRELGVPVHTFWVGTPGLRDVSVSALGSDDFAFVRTVFHLDVIVRAFGYEGAQAKVELRNEGRLLASQDVTLRNGEQRVRFDIVPERVGETYYEVAVAPQPDETILENNTRGFALRVVRDKVRVLHVCGRPDIDVLFMRRFLKRKPNVDLVSFFILRTPTDLQLVPTSELSLIPFPTQELFEQQLGSFDLIVMQNFNFEPYGIAPYLPRLREYIENGGGLAMIGGGLSFSSGGWANTPVGDALPVDLLPPTGDLSRLVSDGEFRPQIVPESVDHPVLRIGANTADTRRAWSRLPGLEGANLVGGLRDSATALMTHPTLRTPGGGGMPLVAVREIGKGRTLSMGTGSSWRWAFVEGDAGADTRAYDRFWENAIRWLIQDPELRQIRIATERSAYPVGARLPAIVRAFGRDYRPAGGVTISLSWRAFRAGQETQLPAVATDENGEARFEIQPPAAGAYRLTANATMAGRQHTDQTTVIVEPPGRELEDPQARAELLREIAQATGGSFHNEDDSLDHLAVAPPRIVAVEGRRQVEIWSGWPLLLVVVGALGLEWAWRRRLGLA